MMLPNQITLQTFTQTGKGGYKAVEVDAFIQRVYQSYNKLYNDNKALCEKLDEILPVIDEYNKRKNSIADALIWAKSTAEKNIEESQNIADKLVSEATEKADKLYEEKKAEADAYYEAKTAEAEAKAATAKAELPSKKSFNWTMLFWVATSYVVSMAIYLIGTFWWTAFIFAVVVAAVVAGSVEALVGSAVWGL